MKQESLFYLDRTVAVCLCLSSLVATIAACKPIEDDGEDVGSMAGGHADGTRDAGQPPPDDAIDGGAASDSTAEGTDAMASADPSGRDDGGAGMNPASEPVAVDVTLLDCGAREITDAVVVDGNVSTDTSWAGTVVLMGDVSVVDQATLTIEPGTTVLAAANARLSVGWSGHEATLLAQGTAEQPIRFCGEQATAGHWRGIVVFESVTRDSVFRHVLLADAGGDGAALRVDMPLLVENVQVRNSGDEGFAAEAFGAGSVGLTVEGSAGFIGSLLGPDAATNFPLGGLLDNNMDPMVRMDFTGIRENVTFHDVGVPYLQVRSVDVSDGAQVTFEAGIDYRFQPDGRLTLGWSGQAASFWVRGTAERPVVFRGRTEEPGFWEGINIRSGVTTDSVIEHAEILHAGGGGEPPLRLESPIAVRDVSLRDNAEGMSVSGRGFGAGSENLSITGTQGAPMALHVNAIISVPQGGDYTGNQADAIVVSGDYDREGTAPNVGVPYRVHNTISTLDGAELTISPGTHFEMEGGAGISFGWSGQTSLIVARGTEQAPIVFSGVSPERGFWDSIRVNENVLEGSVFDWVQMSDGGGDGACLDLHRPVSVTNSSFTNCDGFGIRHRATDASDYTASNAFDNNASGAVGP